MQQVENGLFLPEDSRALRQHGYWFGVLTGLSYADIKREGLRLKITRELEEALLLPREENRSHRNHAAFHPRLFLPGSNNKSLAMQESIIEEYVEDEILKLRLIAVDGGISRKVDDDEIISQFLKRGVILLERGKYPILRARTRTRAFPETAVGVQSYTIDIGPFDPDGLNVGTLGRDEGDPEVGGWPLLWPSLGGRQEAVSAPKNI